MLQGRLKARVYLPDAEKGFYRGTRFDHAGIFGHVEFDKRRLFLPWKDTHDPLNHDDIIGPAEEFGMTAPLGYADARPGETFLKIGVGELEKAADQKYDFAGKYKLIKPCGWKTQWDPAKPDEIRFECDVQGPRGYAYRYVKTLRSDGKTPMIQIGHELTNTGAQPIITNVYNHNFFNADGVAMGPQYKLIFPFDLKAKKPGGRFAEVMKAGNGELEFVRKLDGGFVMAEITGYTDDQRTFIMLHQPGGARVTVTQSEPIARLALWGVSTVICPEPFTEINLAPKSEPMKWTVEYRMEKW